MAPCITGLVLFIVVLRQYGEMFSATASDLGDNRSVFMLGTRSCLESKNQ